MRAEDRETLIRRYAQGPAVVAHALVGLTENELDATPTPDAWTIRMIVHHLADSEQIGALRLRRLLAEDHPTITGYDEARYAQRLHYERPIAASLATLAAVRASTTALLEALAPEEWAREGTHSESGRYGLNDWLAIYAAHAEDHADQITRARAAFQR